MKNSILRTELLASFQDLDKKFSNTLDWARAQEQVFEEARVHFLAAIDTCLVAAYERLPSANPAYAQIAAFIEVMKSTKTAWEEKLSRRKKGVEFQETYGDSLLVFVNGKVKSGKSSLGNYIAWGNTDPTAEDKRQVPPDLVPKYFTGEQTDVKGGDTQGEAQQRREFRVGAIEATSSIQGFGLPGLTWVDSPGLHSQNGKNGELARRYVEHADLILYTMKSDAPGRETDLSEIASLYRRDKKLVLLLTGSDDIDEDVSEDRLTLVQTVVMKPHEKCAKQVAYVQQALERACGAEAAAGIDILSISARYAQLHASDDAKFAESGMGQLFATLQRIAQAEGLLIKQKTPVANLRHFLEGCEADLQPYQDLLAGFKQPLHELKQDANKRLNTVVHAAQADLQSFIDDFFSRLEDERASGNVHATLKTFPKLLDQKFQVIAKDRLADIFEKVMAGFASAVENTYQRSELLRLPDFELRKVTEKIPQVRDGTRGRNSVIGSVIGGVLGFIFGGGPGGAAIGSSIGSGLGSASGDSAATSFREVDITVGDNLQQIRLQALRDSQQALESQLRAAAEALWRTIESEVEQLLDELNGEMQRFNSHLHLLLQATREKQESL